MLSWLRRASWESSPSCKGLATGGVGFLVCEPLHRCRWTIASGRRPPMSKSLMFCIEGLLMVARPESLNLVHLYFFSGNVNTKV